MKLRIKYIAWNKDTGNVIAHQICYVEEESWREEANKIFLQHKQANKEITVFGKLTIKKRNF